MKGGLKAYSYNRKPHASAGYTVTEVLVVLAVTGALFASAAVLISGRQNRTEFSQGIQQLQSQIQQVIGEVSSGYYPSSNAIQCTASGAGINLSSGASEQGTNSDCLFLGKAMQFALGANPEQFAVYSIAGLRQTSTGKEVSTLAETAPQAIAPTAAAPDVPDVTAKTSLQGGLTVQDMFYANNPANKIGAVAFVSSLAQYDAATGKIASGSQKVNVIPLLPSSGTGQHIDTLAMAANINQKLATSPVNPANGVQICLASGGTDQSGLVTIGSGGRDLAVNVSIKAGKTCGF